MSTYAADIHLAFVKACIECSRWFALMATDVRCSCGGLLDITFDLKDSAVAGLDLGQLLKTKWNMRRSGAQFGVGRVDAAMYNSGVWRFHELIPSFPQQFGPDVNVSPVVSLNEGNTPLYHQLPEAAAWAGVDSKNLWIKHLGLNPTGSFKDYGMTVLMTWLKRIGAKQVICASTGNTAASTALSPRRTSPESGGSAPIMILAIVVFPAPFGPITPTMPPRGSSKVTWSKRMRFP